MRSARLIAVATSAALGVVAGVVGGLVLDRNHVEDPLGLDAPMVNQPCQPSQAVLILVSGNTAADLGSDLATHDDARYLETARSCPTAWRRPGKPPSRYAVYLGPASRRDACERQMTGSYLGAHVTLLTAGRPDVELCSCYVAREGIPTLRFQQTMSPRDSVYLHDLQELLTRLEIRPDEPTSDAVDQETVAQIRRFQTARGLTVNGVMGPKSWQRLLRAACNES